MAVWDVEIGTEVNRRELQSKYGGSLGRGISAPAAGSDQQNIMLFWRPEHGEKWGYQDGWVPDGSRFFFTGMGQSGDQSFEGHTPENGRVLHHRRDGMEVRLLRSVGPGRVRYEAHLELAEAFFLSVTDSVGNHRQVIQFEFIPLGEALPYVEVAKSDFLLPNRTVVPVESPDDLRPIEAALEAVAKPSFEQVRNLAVVRARRTEAELVLEFADWMGSRGCTVNGLLIPYGPERRMLRADAYISAPRHLLIEAKASIARESIRMAFGQALDYARFLDNPDVALLLPSEPAKDMQELVSQAVHLPFVSGAGVIWKSGGDFESSGIQLADFVSP